MATTKRAGAVLALVLLAAVVVLSGFRGTTSKTSRGGYINDIRVTANGVYRFARDAQGHTATASAARQVTFLDVWNGTGSEATLTLFTEAGPGSADTVLVYVPALTSRSWPGANIDSIRVAATFAGAAVILGGMD